ncbi:MAG: ATP-binding cassette domain-containing protein, partial ['Prunus persica' phytoplasma PP2]|nr:ATP-binding cassette domain-containing protein ['Prunus persica' phytoplasma PP2]
YQMQINEEADNLSQGEKQLITIARTILSNPKILILDEATSNVDTRIEILLQQAIQKLIQNKTAFVIAHRLSTIVNADKILVLHRGAIIEQGTHQELLNYKGFYYKLYQSQFQK